MTFLANIDQKTKTATRQRLNTHVHQLRYINHRDETAAKNAEAKAIRAVNALKKKITAFESSIAV